MTERDMCGQKDERSRERRHGGEDLMDFDFFSGVFHKK